MRRRCDEALFVLFFFGIPGTCSHEKGMPEYRSGVDGDDGDDDEDDEDEENDGLRREGRRKDVEVMVLVFE